MDPVSLSERELATAWAAGDQVAGDEVGRRFGPPLHEAAGHLLGSQTADDVVRNVLQRAAGRIGGLQDPSQLGRWLFAILHNEAVGWATVPVGTAPPAAEPWVWLPDGFPQAFAAHRTRGRLGAMLQGRAAAVIAAAVVLLLAAATAAGWHLFTGPASSPVIGAGNGVAQSGGDPSSDLDQGSSPSPLPPGSPTEAVGSPGPDAAQVAVPPGQTTSSAGAATTSSAPTGTATSGTATTGTATSGTTTAASGTGTTTTSAPTATSSAPTTTSSTGTQPPPSPTPSPVGRPPRIGSLAAVPEPVKAFGCSPDVAVLRVVVQAPSSFTATGTYTTSQGTVTRTLTPSGPGASGRVGPFPSAGVVQIHVVVRDSWGRTDSTYYPMSIDACP